MNIKQFELISVISSITITSVLKRLMEPNMALLFIKCHGEEMTIEMAEIIQATLLLAEDGVEIRTAASTAYMNFIGVFSNEEKEDNHSFQGKMFTIPMTPNGPSFDIDNSAN